MSEAAPPRSIFLCADDYGISPGVNRAILDLIERGRINATSVMMVAPAAEREALAALDRLGPCCAIGLHVTLSAPFRPLTRGFSRSSSDSFPPFARLLRAGLKRRLDHAMLRDEILAQIEAFTKSFGRPPDFVDGHQHVQLFPQIAGAFVEAVKRAAPDAWVRQCGRARPLRARGLKTLVLDVLSVGFRRAATACGLSFNPAFAGAYDFTGEADFAALMRRFLTGLPSRSVVMCHPGFVDAVLSSLDPMTSSREREYAFLAGAEFPFLLEENNVTLQAPARKPGDCAARKTEN